MFNKLLSNAKIWLLNSNMQYIVLLFSLFFIFSLNLLIIRAIKSTFYKQEMGAFSYFWKLWKLFAQLMFS